MSVNFHLNLAYGLPTERKCINLKFSYGKSLLHDQNTCLDKQINTKCKQISKMARIYTQRQKLSTTRPFFRDVFHLTYYTKER